MADVRRRSRRHGAAWCGGLWCSYIWSLWHQRLDLKWVQLDDVGIKSSEPVEWERGADLDVPLN